MVVPSKRRVLVFSQKLPNLAGEERNAYFIDLKRHHEQELRVARKLVFTAIFLTFASLVTYVLVPHGSSEPQLIPISAPFLSPLEIRNPEIALKYGISGYLEITLAPDSPRSLSIRRGGEASVTILLHFVSHVPGDTAIEVNIDPNGPGLMIEQTYVTEDASGNIVSRGTINTNKLVSYHPSGRIMLKSGETLPVTLTIRIPADLPTGGLQFPLGAVGIMAKVPILDDVRVTVFA